MVTSVTQSKKMMVTSVTHGHLGDPVKEKFGVTSVTHRKPVTHRKKKGPTGNVGPFPAMLTSS